MERQRRHAIEAPLPTPLFKKLIITTRNNEEMTGRIEPAVLKV